MFNPSHELELNKRRTFAIISHPDAGKTTITEKFLLFGKVIRTAGTIKSRGSKKFAKSDWMNIEKERGISVTTSVMQFNYQNILVNLLDTPGHQDFSEDTYRILSAVDCCLVVIDAAKGIEARTKKLIEVTRIHKTPIITFINKLDRDSLDPTNILDQIENELHLKCAPITWPVSCGKNFKGVYHLSKNSTYLYKNVLNTQTQILSYQNEKIFGIDNIILDYYFGVSLALQMREEVPLISQIYSQFNKKNFLKGFLTPIFFGSALSNFGINHLLSSLIDWAPAPLFRESNIRKIYPHEKKFTGFVFKIQANMDLKHRDRIAFIRIVSGQYTKGMKLRHVRIKKDFIVSNAISFIAGDRFTIDKAYPGDIIGLHNHGTIKIGDTFTQGENIEFTGLPSFSPEIFRSICLIDPWKKKQLQKGLMQLAEEGAIQFFRPIINNNFILGAIGILQFDVVIERLKVEYKISAKYIKVNISIARWIYSKNTDSMNQFIKNNSANIALDSTKNFLYLAPNIVNLNSVMNRYPDITFCKIKDK